MAHNVTCTVCGKKFDRDKFQYVETGKRRYAHAECVLRETAKDPSKKAPEIINPLDNVVCIYCKEPMHRVKDNAVLIATGKYAHPKCVEIEKTRELTDKEKLDRYIMELFKTDFVSPRIQQQINKFALDYNFSYTGMQKALTYFYEVKGNSIEKANGGIGIIPYIYKDAYNYYYSLWLARQKNENKVVETYIPEVKEIIIAPPKRKIKKRNLFTFLDEE